MPAPHGGQHPPPHTHAGVIGSVVLAGQHNCDYYSPNIGILQDDFELNAETTAHGISRLVTQRKI